MEEHQGCRNDRHGVACLKVKAVTLALLKTSVPTNNVFKLVFSGMRPARRSSYLAEWSTAGTESADALKGCSLVARVALLPSVRLQALQVCSVFGRTGSWWCLHMTAFTSPAHISSMCSVLWTPRVQVMLRKLKLTWFRDWRLCLRWLCLIYLLACLASITASFPHFVSLQGSGTWVWTVNAEGITAITQTNTASATSTVSRLPCSTTVCPERGAISSQTSSTRSATWPSCSELDFWH